MKAPALGDDTVVGCVAPGAISTASITGPAWVRLTFDLAGASMVTAVYQLYVKQLVQLRWREWLTKRLLDLWMTNARHYQLERAGESLVDRGLRGHRSVGGNHGSLPVGAAVWVTCRPCFMISYDTHFDTAGPQTATALLSACVGQGLGVARVCLLQARSHPPIPSPRP